ncbi:MAG: FkbM family methyltransferase [Stigonema ocellatum SAG 48.90 = DSM 106950]|nr:FkbM family methyltransferase [Stigonema ocellatum SAG 48.90 = DSM 106950]
MIYTIKKIQLLYFLLQRLIKFGIVDLVYGISHRKIAYEAMIWQNLIPIECDTIIDVGANTGDVSAALDFLFRPSLIIAIEPNPSVIPHLLNRFKEKKNVEIVEKALSSTTGKTNFYKHEFTPASSIYKIENDYLKKLGLSEANTSTEVDSITLDEVLLQQNISSIDLLKIDCQGSELEILKGSKRSLNFIKIIHTEVLFKPMYENAAVFWDIHEFLMNRGFELRQLHSFSGLGKAIHWADAIYFNTVYQNT